MFDRRGRTEIHDLLAGNTHTGSDSGTCATTWTWSRGVLTCAESTAGLADAFDWFEDRGGFGYIALPRTWGFGGHAFDVREDRPGRPVVVSRLVAEFAPFPYDGQPRPLPAGTVHALFWLAGGAVPFADATAGGTRRIVSWDGFGWTPVGALAGLDTPSVVGELGNDTVLAVREPWSGAFRLVAFDPYTGVANLLASGFASAPGAGIPFAQGLLFAADDGQHGSEPWFTRGTRDSTRLVADLRAGAPGSQPRSLHETGSLAAFLADDGTGTQLFVLDEIELDWVRCPLDGHYYRALAPLDWRGALRAARLAGGTLATVRNQAQLDWLWRTFGPRDLWIGLQDLDRNGVFQWASGEPLSFTAWCPGEPSHTAPGEVAVQLVDRTGQCAGGWNDTAASARFAAIVERAAPPRPVETVGPGCGTVGAPCGSLGQATLAQLAGRPRLGEVVTFALDLRMDPLLRTTGLLLLGVDSTAFGPVPLPLPLAPFGFGADCALRTNILDSSLLWLDAFGRGEFAIGIPWDPQLVGAPLFMQGIGFTSYGPCSKSSDALRVTLRP
ncbi:MAG: hypothetical protein IPM29_28495 [Planctomycetes bacterium]|nr:hypothetical protein [Planctomycetota bacterium]